MPFTTDHYSNSNEKCIVAVLGICLCVCVCRYVRRCGQVHKCLHGVMECEWTQAFANVLLKPSEFSYNSTNQGLRYAFKYPLDTICFHQWINLDSRLSSVDFLLGLTAADNDWLGLFDMQLNLSWRKTFLKYFELNTNGNFFRFFYFIDGTPKSDPYHQR